MTLRSGERLLHYRIDEKLGEGGMGVVWKAYDTILERPVALKMLPDAGDAQRAARLAREAKLLAALNHPNVASVHGLHEHEGRIFLAMEWLSGTDLAGRLAADPPSISEAVELGRQVAGGLEAAHESGIVHRDLKPSNIFVSSDGRAKVLDFGLGKTLDPEVLDDEETLTAELTRVGSILGTPAYMSPEQTRAGEIDRRTDIWSFGCVLFEMLAGRPPFAGSSWDELSSAIVAGEPEWNALPPGTPGRVRRLLERCLTKDAKMRLRDVGEARIALGRDLEEPSAEGTRPAPKGASKAGWVAAAVCLLAAAAAGLGWYRAARSQRPAPEPLRFEPVTRFAGMETQPSLSPDGRFITYVAEDGGDLDLFLLRVGGDNPINLTADSADDDLHPAFSPDGSWIAFRSEREGGGIFVMGATGESVRRLTDFGFNPAWSSDGGRLAIADERTDRNPRSREVISRLHLVDVTTGATTPVPGEGDRVQPSWSPGGERIAYWGIHGKGGQRDIWTVRLDGSDPIALTSDTALDWNPVWSPDGRFIYFSSDRGGSLNLWRIGVDEATGVAVEPPRALSAPSAWSGQISLAADGSTLAYTALDRHSNIEVAELSATGGPAQPAVAVTRGTTIYHSPSPSPDGEWLTLAAVDQRENLMVVRADGSGLRRLTDDASRNRGPQWSPDGERIAFYSDRDSETYRLWTIRPDGSSLEALTGLEESHLTPIWSPDASRLVANRPGGTVLVDLAMSRPIVSTQLPNPEDLHFQASSWSSDGRSIAGTTYDASGSYRPGLLVLDLETEAFVRVSERLPDTGEFRGFPVWLPDGQRLVFSSEGRIYLLDTRSGAEDLLLEPPPGSRYYYPTPDGQAARLFFAHLEEEADVHLVRLSRDAPTATR